MRSGSAAETVCAVPLHFAGTKSEGNFGAAGVRLCCRRGGRRRHHAREREAFYRWRIVPRMLRDVSKRDLSVEILGARLPAPVILGPVGVQEIIHADADLAGARAAASLGLPSC